MVTLGKFHVGDLSSYVELDFIQTNKADVNTPQDLSSATSLLITFFDPDGNQYGPFNMTFVTDGTDGKAYYKTDPITSLWVTNGFWKWFGTLIDPNGKASTNDVIREILGNDN